MSWRDLLRPASFRGARFHVDIGARSSGRRVAVHEFPHRDDPYAEDLGRRARQFSVTAYCVGPFYLDDRDALVEALEEEGSGLYIHPSQGEFEVMVGAYSTVEKRDKGGYAEFDITFLEAGNASPFTIVDETAGQVEDAAYGAQVDAISAMNTDASVKAGPR